MIFISVVFLFLFLFAKFPIGDFLALIAMLWLGYGLGKGYRI